MNKKGGLGSLIAIVILVLIILFMGFIFYKTFHTTCIMNNLKTLSLNMTNCIR